MKTDVEKDQAEIDRGYMARALQLAAYGAGHVSPNPMVGCVITARGRIIGEGWHRRFGKGHAEVNAMASVKEVDYPLLKEATVYVTLEPCSHYGKTPPCAKMLVEKDVKRVVIAASDPNPLVSGRGARMLREAGIEVSEGIMASESMELNKSFHTSQTERRPWIQLKWAQSSDGFMGGRDDGGMPRPIAYSSPLTLVLMHRERSKADAILVGTGTILADNPSLTLRHWPGRDPRKLTFDSPRLPKDAAIMDSNPLLISSDTDLEDSIRKLFKEKGISSIMVEGGAETLHRFIEAGLYDEVRVETNKSIQRQGVKAPSIPEGMRKISTEIHGDNLIETWMRKDVKKL